MEENWEDGYYFYVLSLNADGTTNLILDRNIYYDESNNVGLLVTESNKGLVAWVSKDDYNDNTNYGNYGNHDKGPITAMNYLHNETKDWVNVPNIVMNYADEGNPGYGSIMTTGTTTTITKKDGTITATYDNLKSKLISKAELNATGVGSWAYESIITTGTTTNYKNIPGIKGYWTLYTHGDASINGIYIQAKIVTTSGISTIEVSNNKQYGVRPVITLEI